MKANVRSKADVSSRRPPADRRKPILYATLAVIAVALVVTVAVLSRQPSVVPQSATESHAAATLNVGQTAPAFAVSTTAGPFDLSRAQTPVLLEVFATWCPHCQRETKILNALYRQYGKQITFVAVSGSNVGMDGNTPASQADVIGFAQKFKVAYPIAFDPDLKVAGAYLQSGFPTIVIIKKDKAINYVADGEISQPTLVKAIKDAL
jgi:thiol-disulfide isomerase/thioredoxin